MPRPIQTAVKELGREATAFALNLSIDELDRVVSGETTLPAEDDDAVGELVDLVTQVRVQAALQGTPVPLLLALTGAGSGRPHPLTSIRMKLGGSVEVADADDPVVTPLVDLAAAVFPSFLIARHASRDDPGLSVMASSLPFQDPGRRKLEDRILADPRLKKLFPVAGKDAVETRSWVESSAGRGGNLQLALLPDLMARKADQLARLRGRRDLAGFVEAAHETVELLRRAADGEVVDMPVLVGLNNVAVQPGQEVELPWGRLVAYQQELAEFVPSPARPSTLGGEGTVLGAVLESTYPYELHVESEAPTDPRGHFSQYPGLRLLEERVELTRLALALAIQRKPPAAAIRGWTLAVDLLDYGSGASWPVSSPSAPIEHYIMGSSDGDSVSEWARTMSDVDDAPIRIARRRVLSALAERHDPTDGLVDAVIAWENLFGSGSGELSLRISTAMAWLLAQSDAERQSLQEQVNGLYHTRSRLLHGDLELDWQTAQAQRDEALDLSIKALRRLYRDRRDLIADKKRALKLLLGL